MRKWNSDIHECGSYQDWIGRLDEYLPPTESFDASLHDIVNNLRRGIHLTIEQGMDLWHYPDLSIIAQLANASKFARFGENVFFNSNLHVNQTNICTLACKFCAFRRGPKAKDAYALEIDEFIERIRPYENVIDEVHTVGGLHPEWDVTHYEELFDTVVFLASENAGYISGQSIPVDGGYSA